LASCQRSNASRCYQLQGGDQCLREVRVTTTGTWPPVRMRGNQCLRAVRETTAGTWPPVRDAMNLNVISYNAAISACEASDDSRHLASCQRCNAVRWYQLQCGNQCLRAVQVTKAGTWPPVRNGMQSVPASGPSGESRHLASCQTCNQCLRAVRIENFRGILYAWQSA
jgi:hypothetical protein